MSAQGRLPLAFIQAWQVTVGSSARSPPWLHHPHQQMDTLGNNLLPCLARSAEGKPAASICIGPPAKVPSCKHGCFTLPLPGAGPILVGHSLAVQLSPRVICRMGVLRTRLPARVSLLLNQREGKPGGSARPGFACRVPAPHASLPPLGASRVPRINLAPRTGYPPESWEGCLGQLKLARFRLAGFTLLLLLQGRSPKASLRGGREGGKQGARLRPCCGEGQGAGRRGLSLVNVIAGELDQQAIFSHLSRKIQVRANS